MQKILRSALLAVVVLASWGAAAPPQARADNYWNGYWGWYDNTYRPYYHRYYRRYPNRYYYGSRYYGTPNFGYRDFRGSGGQVRVGPLRFGWR